MICFARNFEDVMLQRALGEVENGCYLDVGASNPVFDSNTFAFYLKGWRGIGVDPLGYEKAWTEARPDDIFVNAAVGRENSRTIFHVYDQFGQISTGSQDTVEHWKASSKFVPSRRVEVPVYTLNSFLEQKLSGRQLHFVSIDVEGMEADVLRGFDLAAYRPWIIVIEATLPGTMVPCHESWEPLILDAGYVMAYFDGVNRFYLSNEKLDLLPRFAYPPNAFDNFELRATLELEQKYAYLETRFQQLTAELERCKNGESPPATSGAKSWLRKLTR